MAGRIENLKPFTHDQDREAARRAGIKGGKAWGRIRRERARERERQRAQKELDRLRPWRVTLRNSTFKTVLNERQRRFIMEYVIHPNGAAAARAAGYSVKSAKGTAWRLVRRPDIRQGFHDWLAYTRQEGQFVHVSFTPERVTALLYRMRHRNKGARL